MVQVRIVKDELFIKFEAVQKLLALKGSFRIPLENIQNVSTETVKWPWFAIRVATNVPGILAAGFFLTRKGKIFYYVAHREKCITLALKNHFYSKIVLEVENKEAVAAQIRRAIANQ